MIITYFKTLSCRRIAPLLFAQSQNADLSSSDQAKLSAHLLGCAACQTEAAQFARIALDLRQATPKAPLPSADLWSRIQSEITTNAPSPSPKQRPVARPNPFAPRLGGLAWAGSAAIVFVGGAWMTFGAGFWGHNGNAHQGQLPAVSGTASTERPNVTPIPPVLASPLASNTAVMAKATKKASNSVMASSAKPAAPFVRLSFETRPEPFGVVLSASPSKPVKGGTFASRMPAAHLQQTKAATLVDLERLQTRDAQEAARSVTDMLVITTPRAPGFATGGTVSRGGTILPDTVQDAATIPAPAISGAGAGIIATTAPSSPEGEPAAATIVAGPPQAPVTASMANAAPLGVSAAFAYSSVKSPIDSDSPERDDAEPRSIPPAGSGGAFSVGEPTSRMRRQRALFSYGRP